MITDLAVRAFKAREAALLLRSEVVVQPAIPILYFGDADAYRVSAVRILTVALNPSKAEFPTENPFLRFPAAERADSTDAYLDALNAYFVTAPYRSWFSSFEPVLNGAGASYYPGAPSTALHTDLCSPVATDPTWSRLDGAIRESLIGEGAPLWHDLVRELRPDLVLVSLARRHLTTVKFPSEAPFEIARLEEGRKYPYVTTGRWVDVEGHRSLMVFGRAANQPFGIVSKKYRSHLGGLTRGIVDGR